MKRPPIPLLALWGVAALLLGAGVLAASLENSPDGAPIGAPIGGPIEAPIGAPVEAPGVAVATASASLESAPQETAQTSLRDQAAGGLNTPLLPRLRSLLGMILLGLLAWAFSVDRSNVAWRVILWGIGLQLIFAVFILKTPMGAGLFDWLNTVVVALLGFTVEGARFIFGDLVYNNVPVGLGEAGTNAPIQEMPGQVARTGASFAFNVLPTIIFFSSLMTVLYHVGVMQWVVKRVAWVMQKTLGTSGAETLSAAGNIFVGQTEAPLMIKPFFEKMTMSELHAVMT